MRRIPVYAISTETVRQLDCTPITRHMPGRMAKAERFMFEKDRLLCIGGGFLMRKVLGINDEKELRCTESGKLYAPGYPAFNLSHSGEWCIFSEWESEIGVDIEAVDEKNLSVAPMVFTANELKWMEEDPLRRFHQLWTWKESVIKALGTGLSKEPVSFEVLSFTEKQPLNLDGRTWYAASGSIDGYCFSACTASPAEGLEWMEVGAGDMD